MTMIAWKSDWGIHRLLQYKEISETFKMHDANWVSQLSCLYAA